MSYSAEELASQVRVLRLIESISKRWGLCDEEGFEEDSDEIDRKTIEFLENIRKTHFPHCKSVEDVAIIILGGWLENLPDSLEHFYREGESHGKRR